MLAAPYQIATDEENCRCQNHFGMDDWTCQPVKPI
jgi:hypothetical protein